jgi:hypothetical protein
VPSYRTPKGSYTRNTSDWFQGRQCFATAYADFSSLAPSVVAATETKSNNCLVPAGTRINDLMLACFWAATHTQSPSPGTWNLVQDITGSGVNFWWWKYYQAGDPSSFTSTNSLTIAGGNIVTVRGAAVSATPFDVMAFGQATAEPVVAPAITATGSEPELLILQLATAIFNTLSPTPGYTALANISDPIAGNSPAMSASSLVGTGTFPSVSTNFTFPVGDKTANWQQLVIPRAVFSPYASLYNNATDGSVLYVTGVEVEFDAADQLLLSLNSGTDIVPYAAPYGVFAKNPLAANPPGVLFSGPASTLIGYLFQSAPNITSYQRRPSDGDYVAIIPPGFALVATNANLGAKRMAASFDYFYLPSSA